jgi:hypothetical protein
VTEEERSPQARARAESALVRLLYEIGDEAPFLVVLGGLVPAVLARDTAGVIPEHLGTTDIDVLLVSHIDPDADLGARAPTPSKPSKSTHRPPRPSSAPTR